MPEPTNEQGLLDDTLSKVTKVTMEYLAAHPLRGNYLDYVMSDSWRVPEVFIYARGD